MNWNKSSQSISLRAEKQRNGIIYGLLAGLGFAVATWGLDAFLLAGAHAAYPWLKFILGGVLSLLICGLAGWVAARLDSGLASFMSWVLAGLGLAWLASHMPFEGFYPSVMGMLDPQLQDVLNYPFTEGSAARQLVVMGMVAVMAGLVGLFELPMIDSAINATAPAGRWLPLLLCVPLIGLAGSGADNLVNAPLREPIIVIDDLISFRIETQGQQVDPKTAREMHLGALNQVADRVKETRRLMVGNYDETVVMVNVLVDFDGDWSRCIVINLQPSNCTPVEPAQLSSTSPPASQGETNPEPVATEPQATTSQPSEAEPSATPQANSNGQTVSREATPQEPAPTTTDEHTSPGLSQATRYAITLTVDYQAHTFTGQEIVQYTNTEQVSLDSLYFRLFPNGKGSYGDGSLNVSQVLVNGQPATTGLSLSNTVLEVQLPASVGQGENLQLDFAFEGVVPADFGPSGYGIFNFTDGVLALSGWYPILAVYDDEGWNLDPVSAIGDSVYSDIAFYTVDLSAPSELVVAATGTAEERQRSAERVDYRLTSGPARDFFLIMSPDFKVSTQTVDGTKVNSYHLPNHPEGGNRALSVGSDSLSIFNQQFGEYPYPELDIVEAPMRNAAGVEFPGIVLVGGFLYNDYEDPSFDITVAHEVAHQWWYNTVGNDIFDEPWLDEALATYTSSLYYEYGPGGKPAAEGLISFWKNRLDQLNQQGLDDAVTQTLAHFESLDNPRMYGGVVYTKGALFLVALRQEIGDEAFFGALRNYYQAYQFQIATSEGLLSVFEEAAGRQLDDFFQKWLY